MPKRKTVEADVPSVETRKRAPTAKPKAPAATHKRTTKLTVESAVLQPQAVRVISEEEISRLAYSYWEARGFQGGSAEQDWLRAERQLSEFAQDR
jgi:hypothetical protein